MVQSELLIIIVTYNGKEEVLACLESLSSPNNQSDLLVVDNASDDGTSAAIRSRFPETEILRLDVNAGWAGGNNAGLRVALERKYDLVCLLNSDTVVHEGAVPKLVQSATALGPCLLHPAIYYYRQPTEPQLDPSSLEGKTQIPDRDGIFELDYAYGACLMLHTRVLYQIGLIDERFFLQLEETDLYQRARKAGFRSFCDTRARVLHKGSHSFGGRNRSPLKTYYMVRNSFLLAENHRRSILGFLRTTREVLWSIQNIAFSDSGVDRSNSRLAFILWSLSSNPFAIAARMGMKDYILRRFGRLREKSARRLRERPRQWRDVG
jgi:GT2 family glycosyltransferase